MSSSAQHSRRPAGLAIRTACSLILVATLIPVTVFFVQLYTASGEQKSRAERERHGIEYLTALWQLTLSLTEAQSAAVSGAAPADTGAISGSLAAVSLLDERLGDELRTRERWAGLRTKIESLPSGPARNASGAYTAYTEATELLLALYREVREHAELVQDPDADAYFLQDAVAEELPRMLVAAGRLTDLTHLAGNRSAADEASRITALTVVRTAVIDPAEDLSDDLRSAVDGARSRTLSGTLLSQLETFGRRMDTFTSTATAGANGGLPNATAVTNARTDLQSAAATLGKGLLLELDGLFADRISDLRGERWSALATLVGAVLLVSVGVALPFAPRYLRRRRNDVHGRPASDPGQRATDPAHRTTDPGQRVTGPIGRPLVTTSAGPDVTATGGGQSGLGRSDAAR